MRAWTSTTLRRRSIGAVRTIASGSYLYEEPTFLGSLRRGDRREAVRVINYILVHVYAAG
jgi:hypothetical protein